MARQGRANRIQPILRPDVVTRFQQTPKNIPETFTENAMRASSGTTITTSNTSFSSITIPSGGVAQVLSTGPQIISNAGLQKISLTKI